MFSNPGQSFSAALERETPLQIVGTLNALSALIAKEAGFSALYLSGAGVANACFGLPDIGVTTLDNIVEEANRITYSVDLPLLVDIDTGWGSYAMIQRSISCLERAQCAAVHIEDQILEKRCGHLSGKGIVPIMEMVDRIKACVDARKNPEFLIMARTDAFAVEGLEKALQRAEAYKNAGADLLFPEALPDIALYQKFKEKTGLPLLINLTEFGKTPLYSLDEVKEAKIDMALYPLSAARAMYLSARHVYEAIRQKGSQNTCLSKMLTRNELYQLLKYKE